MELKELTIKDLLSGYILVIPEIQREYVWGSNKEVLGKFLSELNVSLQNVSDSNIGFLYSYDAGNNEHFIIDGQQRLTTIVLLAYYYAVKDDRTSDFKTLLKTETPLIHFSYRVRPLTEQFLQNLFTGVSLDILKNLKEAKWYVSDYDNDKTIESICNLYKFICDDKNSFSNLNYDSLLRRVKFYYFDVQQTSQGEELYITMNSRGEQLKDSEQIKPYILENIKDNKARSDAAKQWDDWEEYFFKLKKSEKEINEKEVSKIDIAMDNIIKITLELYGEKRGVETDENRKREFEEIKAAEDSKRIDFSKIAKVVENIISLLDSGKDEIQKREFIKFLFTKEREKKPLYLIESLIRAKELIFDDENIHRLIRLVNNSLSYEIIDHVPLLKFLSEMKKTDDDLYKYIKSLYENEEGAKILKGVFVNDGNMEELEKIKAIHAGVVTEKDIDKAEKTAFFDGRIHFLYRDAEGDLDWNSFAIKWANAKGFFDESGVKRKYKTDAILLKALISRCKDFWHCAWRNYKIFNNEASTWKDILLSEKWKNAVCDILSGNIDIVENVNDDEKIAKSINDWCNDKGLLNYISKNRSCAWIRSVSHGYFSFWESGYPAYMIPTIPILLKLKRKGTIDYRDECIIPDSEYATCTEKTESGIDFSYKHRNFRWYMYPSDKIADIYLLDDEWNWLKKDTVEMTTDDDHEKYYCFDVKDEMNDDIQKFTKELDNLINSILQKK